MDYTHSNFRNNIFIAKTFDNINLLPNPYKEEEDMVILRVTESEIEEVFSRNNPN